MKSALDIADVEQQQAASTPSPDPSPVVVDLSEAESSDEGKPSDAGEKTSKPKRKERNVADSTEAAEGEKGMDEAPIGVADSVDEDEEEKAEQVKNEENLDQTEQKGDTKKQSDSEKVKGKEKEKEKEKDKKLHHHRKASSKKKSSHRHTKGNSDAVVDVEVGVEPSQEVEEEKKAGENETSYDDVRFVDELDQQLEALLNISKTSHPQSAVLSVTLSVYSHSQRPIALESGAEVTVNAVQVDEVDETCVVLCVSHLLGCHCLA